MLKIKTGLYIPTDMIKIITFHINGVSIWFRDESEKFYVLAAFEMELLAERLDNA